MLIKDNTISCDFDGTIDDHFNGEVNPHKYEIRGLLKNLIQRGYDVYIVTRRFGPDNSSRGIMDEHLKVWEVADELGIPRDRIIFTAREWKYNIIESIGACMHIDDDYEEMRLLQENIPAVKKIWLGNQYWKTQVYNVINSHNPLTIWLKKKNNSIWFGLAIAALFLTIFLFS